MQASPGWTALILDLGLTSERLKQWTDFVYLAAIKQQNGAAM
jgi:hypothetical protein